MKIKCRINSDIIETEINVNETLCDMLRRLEYYEVKKGCGQGDCGACCVLLNGKTVNSCMVFAARVNGSEIVTVKGLGNINKPHILQESYVETGAVQCGFCTPGSVISAESLLRKNPEPDDNEIKVGLSGNLCRCTGYYKQIEAVKLASEKLKSLN